jgi:hypothetical protein
MVNSAVVDVGTRRPPIKPVRGAAQPPEPKVTLGFYSQNSSVAVTRYELRVQGGRRRPGRGERTKACQDRDLRPWARGSSVEVVTALAEIQCRVR